VLVDFTDTFITITVDIEQPAIEAVKDAVSANGAMIFPRRSQT
jgi:hypothetical protein